MLSFHTACLQLTDVIEDIKVAVDAGFDGMELWMPKVDRYFREGHGIRELCSAKGSLRVTMLDVLLSIERTDLVFQQQLRENCDRMATIAKQLHCPYVQVVALNDFPSYEWSSMRSQLVNALNPLAEIAFSHGVRLALEPVSFSPFHSLEHALEIIHIIGHERIGLVLDTWHLWTAGTPWRAVADLDPAIISCVHIGDCKPRAGETWSDEDRTALPGEGVVPLVEAIDAIRSTGFNGTWSVEILGKEFEHWSPENLARSLFEHTTRLLI